MFADKSRITIISGFAAVMLLMLAVIFIGYAQIEQSRRASEELSAAQNRKTGLILSMYTAVLERSAGLLRMAHTDDPFLRDEEFMRMNELATRYVLARQALSSLLDGAAAEFFRRQQQLLSQAEPLQQEVVDLLVQERRDEALRLIGRKLVPLQKQTLELLRSMMDEQEAALAQAGQLVKHREQETLVVLVLLVVVAAIIGFGIVRRVIRKTTKARDALFAKVTLESIADAVLTTDARGRVTYLNHRAQRLLGPQGAAVCGQPLSEVLPFGAGQGCDCHLGSRSDGAHSLPFSGECALLNARGDKVHVDVSVSPIMGAHMIRLGSVIVLRDITRSKKMEQTLRMNEQRFSLIMRGTNDGIWDYNLESGELYFSPRWKSMLGYREEEFADSFHEWQRYIHPNDLGQLLDAWTDCMSGETPSFSVEYRMKMKDGEWKWVDCRGLALLDDEGTPIRLAGSHTDISQRKDSERELYWNSTHDGLTGLVNRREFERRLEEELKIARRTTAEHALMYIDLDQFKVINDTCGHVAGDELLRQISSVLSRKFRDSDTLARLGGDEFGVLLKGCPVSKALAVAASLREAIEEFSFVWQNKTFRIGASIGVVAISRANASRNEVLSAADIACYTAKDLGRNRVHLYQESDDQMALRYREMRWVSRITTALQEERFVLYAQPIVPVDAAAGRPALRETLVRMLDEEGKLVPPGTFIPSAERYNLMPAIDRWVIRTLFARLQVDGDSSVISTVNLSGSTINEDGFLDFVKEQFQRFGVRPDSVCFEITETSAIANLSQAAVFIGELKQLGCLFALDDFGSGLSSFGYLKNLPVDYLKIDGQFVRDMVEDPIDAAMVSSINQIGQVMGMQTIAEFVEDDAILECLVRLGVDYAQGYGIARPVPLDSLCGVEALPAPIPMKLLR